MEPEILAQVKTVGETAPSLLFDPNFLNLQFFFNLVLVFFKWLSSLGGLVSSEGILIDRELLEKVFLSLTAVLLFGVFYSIVKLRALRRREGEHLSSLHIAALETSDISERNYQWEKILDLLDSFNESDWRVAIIKADTMLETMLDTLGYYGDTVGDRLKKVEESDFLTLSSAWEAHKVRNRITHEGGFVLTKREARRVIDLYKEVFEEFHFI